MVALPNLRFNRGEFSPGRHGDPAGPCETPPSGRLALPGVLLNDDYLTFVVNVTFCTLNEKMTKRSTNCTFVARCIA